MKTFHPILVHFWVDFESSKILEFLSKIRLIFKKFLDHFLDQNPFHLITHKKNTFSYWTFGPERVNRSSEKDCRQRTKGKSSDNRWSKDHFHLGWCNFTKLHIEKLGCKINSKISMLQINRVRCKRKAMVLTYWMNIHDWMFHGFQAMVP